MISALDPRYGCKRSLGPWIAAQFGPHAYFADLFCGSLALIFAKHPVSTEIAIDLDGHLINLARVLKDPDLAVELYERMRSVSFCDALFDDAKAELLGTPETADSPALDWAVNYMIVSWMGRNGSAGTTDSNLSFARRFGPGGGDGALRFSRVADSIPAWHGTGRKAYWTKFRRIDRRNDDAH